MSEEQNAEYWEKYPEMARRVELTAFFGCHYDQALASGDWRSLAALARWAQMQNLPLLARKALRAAERRMPVREKLFKLYVEVMTCCW